MLVSPGWALLGTVALASVLGSLHCAVMCGPLVSACHAGGARRLGTEVAYQSTRGIGYVVLGALSGTLGAAVDWAGQAAGLARTAAVVSGLFVVLSGLFWLIPALNFRGSALRSGSGGRLLGRGLVRLRRQRPGLRAALLGILTPVLPCGYLYAFVLSAAGTGSTMGGALLMAAFWLGTLPALVLVGVLVGRLSAALRPRLPILTGVVLVAMGVLGVFGRGFSGAPTSTQTPAEALGDLVGGERHEHSACH